MPFCYECGREFADGGGVVVNALPGVVFCSATCVAENTRPWPKCEVCEQRFPPTTGVGGDICDRCYSRINVRIKPKGAKKRKVDKNLWDHLKDS